MPALTPPVTDERHALITYLDQQRDSLATTAFGLTEEQLRAAPTAGTLTIGGLLKHLATTEAAWVDRIEAAPGAPTTVGTREERAAAYGEDFRLSEADTLESLLDALSACGDRTRATLRGADLDAPVPVPRDAPWFPQDLASWSVRWVVLHLIEEAARHAGHADIVRESIDGATTYELVAGREGWPETPWLTPWRPGGSA